jgi:hypothetical protein
VLDMAWRARIHYPGAVYHVMLREKGGRDSFVEAFEPDGYAPKYL